MLLSGVSTFSFYTYREIRRFCTSAWRDSIDSLDKALIFANALMGIKKTYIQHGTRVHNLRMYYLVTFILCRTPPISNFFDPRSKFAFQPEISALSHIHSCSHEALESHPHVCHSKTKKKRPQLFLPLHPHTFESSLRETVHEVTQIRDHLVFPV